MLKTHVRAMPAVRIASKIALTLSVGLGQPAASLAFPVADAGGGLAHIYRAFVGGPLLLDASGSLDTEGLALSYAWDLNLDGDYGDLTGVRPTVSTAQFITDFPRPGTYGFGLRVTNSAGQSSASFATLVVGDHAPTAVPGGPYTTRSRSPFKLDGTGSYDMDEVDSITYAWDLNNDGLFADSTLASPLVTFGGPVDSVYSICLKVTDQFGLSDVKCTTATVVLPDDSVPEPGTTALVALALCGVALSRRKSSAQVSSLA